MKTKLVSVEEAAGQVGSGEMLALGGMTLYRRPVSFVRALIQRFQQSGEPGGLTLLAFTAGYESDLLVGAGLIKAVRTCYFGLEIFGLAPMFTEKAARGEIKIIEETEVSISCGLRAAMAGVGFMPGLGWLGTDLPRLRPDVRTINDPYSGETLMAFPAIHPTTAVIHALCADEEGNCLIGENRGIDEELAVSAQRVIITAEEISPPLQRADITAPYVDLVVHAPRGAAPTSCHPLYALDGQALLAYSDLAADQIGFNAYLKHWMTGGL